MENYRMCMCFIRKFKIMKAEPLPDIKDAFKKYSEGGSHMTPDQLHHFLLDFQGDLSTTLMLPRSWTRYWTGAIVETLSLLMISIIFSSLPISIIATITVSVVAVVVMVVGFLVFFLTEVGS